MTDIMSKKERDRQKIFLAVMVVSTLIVTALCFAYGFSLAFNTLVITCL